MCEYGLKCFAPVFWQGFKEMRTFFMRHSLNLKITSVILFQGSVVTSIEHKNTKYDKYIKADFSGYERKVYERKSARAENFKEFLRKYFQN